MADTTAITESRIKRVYRDLTRDPDFYGGHTWKVEYTLAYSHADRWFTSQQEAEQYADEQEGFRFALASAAEPPAGFTPDPTCGRCFPVGHGEGGPCSMPTTYSGPSRYISGNAAGISTSWNVADGLEFFIDQRPSAVLDLPAARELMQLLADIIKEVQK